MKHIFLSFAFLLLANFAQATIRRVGYLGAPIANIDFSYNNIQSAANTANPGDTLQIYQQLAIATTFYLDVNKPLKIIGFGHTLNINTGNQVQNVADGPGNVISNLRFSPGSAGSVVQGLNLSSCVVSDSNITVTRCRFKGNYITSAFNACGTGTPFLYPTDGGFVGIEAYTYPLKNITINGCYFDQGVYTGNIINCYGSFAMTNIVVTNNYFNGPVNLFTGTTGQVYGVFANNIMNHTLQHLIDTYNGNGNVCTQGAIPNSWAPHYISNFDYFMIKNNIFNTDDTVRCTLNAPHSVIQNNIFSMASQYACPAFSSTNNVYKANMTTVFGAAWNNGMVYNDNQLALGASSAAINTGIKENGTATNCGVFGGETGQQYRLSGIPSVPSVYLLATPGINAPSNPFNITVSVKSNN